MRALVLFLADVVHATVIAALTVWIVWLRTGWENGLLAAATIMIKAMRQRRQDG